jgi:hypothetical protein
MTKNYSTMLEDIKGKLIKALDHLEFSYHKIQNLPDEVDEMDDETMEIWESFTARFGRCADIFMNRYLRTVLLNQDPAYEGSLRDF